MFVLKMVSAWFFLPMKRPVLTSIATRASVCSITRKPPRFIQTFLSRLFFSSASIPNLSKTGRSPWYRWMRSRRSGEKVFTYCISRWWSSLLSTTTESTSSLKMSRIRLTIRPTSSWTTAGALDWCAVCWISFQRSRRYCMSRSIILAS